MQLRMIQIPYALALITALALSACSSSDSDKDSGGTAGDGGVADADGAVKDAPADEPFGRACELGKPCKDEDPEGYPLVCIAAEGSKEGMGFCTRTCNPKSGGPECYGVANGQWASCYLRGPEGDAGPGLSYCVYLCKSPQPQGSWDCPGTLRCGKENDDGLAFCLP